MDKLKQFTELYKEIKSTPAYVIRYESTGRILGYDSAPYLLIGRIPVYEKKYVVKELKLTRKDDLFSALIGTYGEYVFSNKDEAEKKAAWLNEHSKELDTDDLLL